MSAIQLELDAVLVGLLRQSDRPVERTARELIVLELYRQAVISSGKAAELLGMSRVAFIEYASRLGIPFFDMTKDEFDQEAAHLGKI